ncbi:uncharacterized protein DUF1801 [Zhihengliuella halotolerans]|uniref:Uncharacterized protein DUF1801 n=2 Tax=Zhihengliuella halotolerans TaxID=370736 RepID=A0A4V2G9Y4_9MICC|nr:uncharacterized protein DUF1801 [Zhihengliuella halotolerans]
MDEDIRAIFDSYSEAPRAVLLELRSLIFATAATFEDGDRLTETVKWGQPSYAALRPGKGTAVRLGTPSESEIAVLVHCGTSLISTFRRLYPELQYSKNRAILLHVDQPLPREPLKRFVEMALAYPSSRR